MCHAGKLLSQAQHYCMYHKSQLWETSTKLLLLLLTFTSAVVTLGWAVWLFTGFLLPQPKSLKICKKVDTKRVLFYHVLCTIMQECHTEARICVTSLLQNFTNMSRTTLTINNIRDNLNERYSHELQQSLAFFIVLRCHFDQSFLKLLNILWFLWWKHKRLTEKAILFTVSSTWQSVIVTVHQHEARCIYPFLSYY